MTPRVLFLCKQRIAHYGMRVSSGLFNSARMCAEMLQPECITKLVDCVDANDIDREVTKFNPTHVIIEAMWVPPAKFVELFRIPAHAHRKWFVRDHSKTPFIATEGTGMALMLEYARLGHVHPITVAPNSLEVTHELREAFGRSAVYLPNIYKLHARQAVHRPLDVIRIGCFGALRSLKNQTIQAVAAAIYARRTNTPVEFHINATRMEENGNDVFKSIRAVADNSRILLRTHDWLSHHDFLGLVAGMDVLTQVSFTETFNIVAADATSQGVPVIGSEDISWLHSDVQVDTGDAHAIADLIERLVNHRTFRHNMVAANLDGLRRSAAAARSIWLRALGA